MSVTIPSAAAHGTTTRGVASAPSWPCSCRRWRGSGEGGKPPRTAQTLSEGRRVRPRVSSTPIPLDHWEDTFGRYTVNLSLPKGVEQYNFQTYRNLSLHLKVWVVPEQLLEGYSGEISSLDREALAASAPEGKECRVARPLDILVCIKQVLDTQVSSEELQIGGEPPRVSAPGVPPVLDPYSLNALKGALDLKAAGGATITVLSVGASPSKGLLLKSLGAGADRVLALRIAPAPEALGDGLRAAGQLAALVRRVERFDLVLAGRMGADTCAGTTGPLLAALLDLPLVTMATRLQRETETQLFVERLASEEIEQLSCPLPAMVTVSSEIGEPPPVSVASILREARSKPFEVLEPAELGLLTDIPLGIELVSLVKPSRERNCRMVSGGDGRLCGSRLVEVLRQEGVL